MRNITLLVQHSVICFGYFMPMSHNVINPICHGSIPPAPHPLPPPPPIPVNFFLPHQFE